MLAKNHLHKLRKTILTTAFLLPTMSFAAGTATIEISADSDTAKYGGNIATAQWLNTDTIRFDMPDDQGYMLARDEKIYMISDSDGEALVMDMTGMAQMAMAFADKDLVESIAPDIITKVQPTGKKETIAGITGELYTLSVKEQDGSNYDIHAVLSDNKAAKELTQIAANLMQNMMGLDNMQELIDQLPKNKHGILRIEDVFTLVAISDQAPNNQNFELPAEPISMQNTMMQMIQKMQ